MEGLYTQVKDPALQRVILRLEQQIDALKKQLENRGG